MRWIREAGAPRGLATRGSAEEQGLLRQPPGTLRVRASALSCGRFRCRSTDTLSPSRRGLYRRNSKQEGIWPALEIRLYPAITAGNTVKQIRAHYAGFGKPYDSKPMPARVGMAAIFFSQVQARTRCAVRPWTDVRPAAAAPGSRATRPRTKSRRAAMPPLKQIRHAVAGRTRGTPRRPRGYTSRDRIA